MTPNGSPRQPVRPRPRLELVWPGKDQFLLTPSDDNGKPVWVEPDHPAAHEVRISDLTGAYGAVNDTDPYADSLLFIGDGLDVLRILTEVPEYRRHYRGKVKLIYIDPPFNTGQTFTHYDDWMEHSTWLSFMRDRLILAKELLAPDGSIWVHLDERESHRMRCLMDEVFGSAAYVGTVLWRKKYKAGNSLGLSTVHNPILVYGRQSRWRRSNGLPPGAAQMEKYKNPDDDPRGRWRMTHAGDKTYLVDLLNKGAMPTTWWDYDDSGHTETGTNESEALFGEAFSTPKPERLMERVIHVATNPGDTVIDVFGGSGTTAAVAHKMGRRWVTAEILPDTVAQFTEPRLRMVVDGEHGGISERVGWSGGGGFRTVTVGPSMYEATPYGVMLAGWATNGRFARAVAGQLGFTFQSDAAPFCGQRGRMRLAVLDGAVGPEEVREIVGALGERERVTIVAKVVLPDAEQVLKRLSAGSVIRKAPRDVLEARRRRRRTTVPADTVEQRAADLSGGEQQ
ncbi:MAG: site-specific DNA-methyltransferase [Candidatus Nanopelagicales bacterium]